MCTGDLLFISCLQGIFPMTGPIWSERPIGFALMSLRDGESDKSLGRAAMGHVMVRLMSHQQMPGNHMGGGRAGVRRKCYTKMTFKRRNLSHV